MGADRVLEKNLNCGDFNDFLTFAMSIKILDLKTIETKR